MVKEGKGFIDPSPLWDEDGKAWLLLEQPYLRLVVFGDQNSKRSVSNVVQIIVE